MSSTTSFTRPQWEVELPTWETHEGDISILWSTVIDDMEGCMGSPLGL